MATKEQKSRDHFPVTPKELADFAARLTYVAGRMSDIAAALGKLRQDHLMVTGKPTAERGEKFLVAWMKSLQGALDKAAMGEPTDFSAREKLGRKPPKKE